MEDLGNKHKPIKGIKKIDQYGPENSLSQSLDQNNGGEGDDEDEGAIENLMK